MMDCCFIPLVLVVCLSLSITGVLAQNGCSGASCKGTPGLINYWPLKSLSVNADLVGSDSISSSPVNAQLSPDRFNKTNNAIYLNYGYLTVPPDIYFAGDFTISVWAKVYNCSGTNWVIDFGNGQTDNVLLSVCTKGSSFPAFYTLMGRSNSAIASSTAIPLNQWVHLVATSQQGRGKIFINAIKTATGSLYTPTNVLRTTNFIGKNNFNDPYPNAVFSDLKIFNRALRTREIQSEFDNSRVLINCALVKSINNCTINGLQNYWPMTAINSVDVVSGNTLVNSSNARLAPDRFGVANSAVYLNSGYLVPPEDVYFNGDYTISAWVFIKSCDKNIQLMEFANDGNRNLIGFGLSSGTSCSPYIVHCNEGGSCADVAVSNVAFETGRWYYIANTLRGASSTMYINGIQTGNKANFFIPNDVYRRSNYVGNCQGSCVPVNAIIDEVKIYNRALRSDEIQLEFAQNTLNYVFQVELVNFHFTGSVQQLIAAATTQKSLITDMQIDNNSTSELVESFTSSQAFEHDYKLEFSQTSTFTFSLTESFKVSTSVGIFGTGVDSKFSFSFTYGYSQSLTQTQAWSSSTSVTYGITQQVTVPAKSRVSVSGFINWVDNLNLPFTAIAQITASVGGKFLKAQTVIDLLNMTCAIGNNNVMLNVIDTNGNAVNVQISGSFTGSYGLQTILSTK